MTRAKPPWSPQKLRFSGSTWAAPTVRAVVSSWSTQKTRRRLPAVPRVLADHIDRVEVHERQVRQIAEGGVTVLVTTHLMEEADLCSRLAILRLGKLLACDTPANHKARIGGDVITLASPNPQAVREAIVQKLGVETEVVGNSVRLERPRGHEFVPQLIEAAPGLVDSVSVGKPTLQDVFIRLTGQANFEETDNRPERAAR